MLNVISLGAGVQSTTMALIATRGETWGGETPNAELVRQIRDLIDKHATVPMGLRGKIS